MRRRQHVGFSMLVLFLTELTGISLQNDICAYGFSGWELLLPACLAWMLFGGWLRFRKRFLLFGGGFLALSVLACFLWVGFSETMLTVKGFFSWYFGGGPGTQPCYGAALLITAAMLFVPGIFAGRLPMLQAGISVLLIFALGLSLFDVISLENSTVTVIGIELFVELILLAQRKKAQRERLVFTLIPVILFAGILLLEAPKPKEPYRWEFVQNTVEFFRVQWNNTVNRVRFYRNGTSDVFSIAFSGYSEDAGMAGEVSERDRTDLQVTFQESPRTNLYLRGSVWDTFTGEGWIANAAQPPAYNSGMLQKAVNAAEQELLAGEEIPDLKAEEKGDLSSRLLRRMSADITYQELYTRTIFLPENSVLLGIAEKGRREDGNRISKEKPEGEGFSYRVTYHQCNLGSTEWDAFVTYMDSKAMEYQKSEEETTYEAYVKETYGAPPVLSSELEKHLKTRVGDEKSYQTLLDLADFLGQYAYSERPGKTEGDFLDFFLLEKREGYCTYFATAFTLLARYYGYPARYVQGYRISARGVRAGEPVNVSSSDAHAWSEVWLEGIGWIPFDPTPAGGEDFLNTPWDAEKKPQTTGSPEEFQEEIGEEEPEITAPELQEREEHEFHLLWFICLTAVLPICGLGILEIRYRARRRRLGASEAFEEEMEDFFWLLERLGMKREAWETLEVFETRLKRKPEFSGVPSEGLIGSMEAYIYGEIVPKEETLEQLRQENSDLANRCRNSGGALSNLWLFLCLRYRKKKF